MKKILILLCAVLNSLFVNSQSFTQGNIVVLQANDGTSALSSTGTPIFLKEYTPAGSATLTYTIPVNSNSMTMSGSATSEGALTLSGNGQYLVVAGYNAPVGTTGVASSASSVTARMIAAVNATGGITYTNSSSFYTGNNLRGAASDGLGNFWGAGGNSGTCYFGTTSTATAVQTSSTNTRFVQVFSGGLYFSTGSSPSGIFKIGSGTPVTSGQTNSLIINTSTVGTSPSPYAFCFNPGFTICYVADDRANASGGIQKWVNSAGTWTLAYTLPTGVTNIGARSVIADFSGANPVIYGTSAEASLNRIFKIVDAGASSTGTTLVTAGANTIFRGLAFSPSSCNTASISSVSSNTQICNSQSFTLNVNAIGSSPLSYTWSGPGALSNSLISNPVLSGPVSGDYTVSVSNACGSNSAIVSISVNPQPTLVAGSVTICNGNSATLAVSGASSYSWSNGSNGLTAVVSPTINTSYTVSGTNSVGCVGTSTVNVTVNDSPTISVNTQSICSGNQATLIATGAVTYTWSNSAVAGSIIISPSATTIYSLTGTDANGCSNTATTAVNVTASPSLTVNSGSICSGQSGTLTVSGATNYTWSTSSNGTSISDNPSSTTIYSVTGESGGCLANGTATLSVFTTPTLTINQATVCSGATATLNVSGASSYTWSNGSNAAAIVITPTANISYSVSGSSSACFNTASTSVVVNPLPVLSLNSASICSGASATLNVSGAASYTWNTSSNSSSITVSPSSTTIYTVTGTSALACTASATASVSVNATPTLSINSATVCIGNTATLSASGAGTYTWSNGSNSTSIVITPTASSSYSVSGTSNSCTNSNSASVVVNPLPVLSVNSGTICSGSNALLSASGASSYTWNTAANAASISVSPSVTTSYTVIGSSAFGCVSNATSNVFVNATPSLSINTATVCAGASATLNAAGASSYTWNTGSNATFITPTPSVTSSYTLSGTAANGCIANTSTTVTVIPLPVLNVTSSTICAGSTTSLTASGAASYSWNTGSTNASIAITPTSSTIYTVTGTSLSCSASNTAAVIVNALPVINAPSISICSGGSATLSASGASSYTWNTGSNSPTIVITPTSNLSYTVGGTSLQGCSNSVTTAITISSSPSITVNSVSVCAGNPATLIASGVSSYTWSTGANTASITVTPTASAVYTVSGNGSGCSAVASNTLAVNYFVLPTLTANSATACAGTTSTLNASGASTYSWSNGTLSSSVVITPSASASYTVSGTSSQGCVNTAVANISVTPNPTVSVTSATICAGSSATLSASGANSYSCSNSATSASILANPTITTSYTITGTSNGCSNSVVANVTVNNLPTLSVASPTICSGNAATLTAGGANSYSWSGVGTGNSIVVSPSVTSNYTLTGVSLAGCSNSITTPVTVNGLPTITVNSSSVCSGSSATLIATGANTYTWSTSSTNNSIVITPGSTAIYSITGTSSLGCVNSASVQVSVTPLPTLSVNSGTICSGNAFSITVGGALTYSWSTSATTNSIVVSPTSTTVYSVSGSALGCSAIVNATVNVNALPTVAVNAATICAGGSATLIATGANTYTWSNSTVSNSIVISPTLTNSYSVSGTSLLGCVNSASSSVVVSNSPAITVNSSTICSGTSVTLTATGVTSYTWITGATSASIVVSPATSTNYVVAGNASGCPVTASTVASVSVNPLPVLSVNSSTICSGQSATLNASGANTYAWSNGSTNNSISVSPASNTSYSVTGVSAQGCSATTMVSVLVNSLPTPTLNVTRSTLCLSDAAMSLSGAPLGGTLMVNTGTSAIFNPTIVGIGTHTLSYVYTDGNNCSATATQTVQVNACTGITTMGVESRVSVYPNPAKNQLFVHLTYLVEATIDIFNTNGQKVMSQKITGQEAELNVSELNKGLYFIKLNENTKSSFIKFIKE